jgi:alpha-1,6-mannosyltransferase
MNPRSANSIRPPHWADARPWQTNAALVAIGTAMLCFTRQLIVEYDPDHYVIGKSGVSSAQVFLYLAAAFVVWVGRSNRFTFPIILTFAIACRMVALYPDPILSSDIYRYVWDGIVQHAHINPYRYVPADPHLAFLRDASEGNIYPAINRATYARTIYPPVAQMLFYAVTWISPTVTFMKTVMILFEGLLLWATLQMLKSFGIPRERAILYAWCPLPIWEIAGSGHLDAAAMAFIALAMLFRLRNRPVFTGVFLGLAIFTKFYPLVLFPALYNRFDRNGRIEWKMPAIIAAIGIASYAVYLSVGRLVFGFLGGYVQEEGMESGSRYFPLQFIQHLPGLHNVPNAAYLIFAAFVLGGLTLWAWLTASRPVMPSVEVAQQAPWLRPAFALASALMLLFSPHYPWYVAWLIPFLVLLPNLPMLTYICGLFYLCTTAIATGYGPKQYLLNEYLYGWVALAVVVHFALRRLDKHHC